PVEPRQTTDTVIMVSPDHFGFNAETAGSNAFQHAADDNTLRQAHEEFSAMVKRLEDAGVRVIVLPSRKDVATPDAVFPNNWFSLHKLASGKRVLVLYPMLAPNRRAERQPELLQERLRDLGMPVDAVVDLSGGEQKNQILEGTGSMILDRVHGVTFAALSPRTSPEGLQAYCDALGYEAVTFHSQDKNGDAIYHTNVMMGLGDKFAVVCLESIRDPKERQAVVDTLERLGKKIIPITLDQVYFMCGNIIELRGADGKPLLLLSRTAYDHFTSEQKAELEGFCTLLPVDIGVIEKIGGGSARCMVGEAF
ncbi:MAG: citrulline utilization hydrolase CtlX, partial [Desulfovibrionaceae bacterium]